jgi:hypothetical protein
MMFSKFAGKDDSWSNFFTEEMMGKLNKEAVRPMGLQPGEKSTFDVIYENALLNITNEKTLGLLEAIRDAEPDVKTEASNKMLDYMFASVSKFKVELPKEYRYALVKGAEDVLQHFDLPVTSHKYREFVETMDEREVQEGEAVIAMNVPVHGLLSPTERALYLEDRAKQKDKPAEVPAPVDLPWADDKDVIDLTPDQVAPEAIDFSSLEAGMLHYLKKYAAYNPVEEEYLDREPEPMPGEPDDRHFHSTTEYSPHLDDEVWGLDLDDEDLESMEVSEPSDRELKLRDMINDLESKMEELDDSEWEAAVYKISDLLGELDAETAETSEEEFVLASGEIPLSFSKTSKKKAKTLTKKAQAVLPSLPGDEGLSAYVVADLMSAEVPELLEEDVNPSLKRVHEEIAQLEGMINEGFDTGSDLDSASDELETTRKLEDRTRDILNLVQDVKAWYSDARNTSYTESTGKLPE